MEEAGETTVTLMQRVSLQAEVLVPLLRHLRAKLGEQEANALVYPVLRAQTKAWIAGIAASRADGPVAAWQATSERLGAMFDGDVDWTVLEHDADRLDLDVTRCRFAEFFRRIGEPELGAILTCELDDHVAGLSGPAVSLTRATTMMNGATHCPFRYRFAASGDPE